MTNNKGQTLVYKRVSTVDQNMERQDYLDEGADRVFEDRVSSVADRPQLEALKTYAREGDLIRVHSIDRFARDLKQLKIMIDELLEKGVSVEFCSENLKFEPRSEKNVYSDIVLSVLGAIYEFERKMMLIRQAEGIAKAKAQGKYAGRAPQLTREQVTLARKRVSEGVPKSVVARDMGVSRPTIGRAMKDDYVPRDERDA